MKRLALAAVVGGFVGMLAGENRAAAQLPLQPGVAFPNRPVISPYINLLRNNTFGLNNGTLGALNYYGLVQPQFAFQGQINTLQQQVATNQQMITTGLGATTGVPVTGHPAYFLSSGAYFLNNLRGGPGQGGALTGGTGSAGSGFAAGGRGIGGFAAGGRGVGGFYAGGAGAGLNTAGGGTAPRR
jgi:hypothetical protein